MKIRKFLAKDMAEALSQVKRELGPDAMIVGTRPVKRGLLQQGIEVTAAIDVDDPDPGVPTAAAVPPTQPRGLNESDLERLMAPLRSEIRSLRQLIRPLLEKAQKPSVETEEPLRAELTAVHRALNEMRSKIPSDSEHAANDRRLVAPSERRIVALVGPTGVGKTTTIAKLAARAALIEQRSVALVTLDTYRVGGEEQLRAYADLIGVPLLLCADPKHLAPMLASLSDVDAIFIDTAGRSPRDSEAIAALERAFDGIDDLEVHLAIAAGSSPRMCDSFAQIYRGVGIDRLLFTKLDEAHDLSELAAAPIRVGRPVSWLTVGQRVPEDIEPASSERMIALAKSGFAAAEVAA